MVTLTEKDLMELLQKNNLREDALEKEVVERLAALHLKPLFKWRRASKSCRAQTSP